MARWICALAAALLLAASSATAKDLKKKEATPGEVDVVFANGSQVRMLLNAEKIEVVTPYGKLLVPLFDIQEIEFGIHAPAGMDAKVAAAIQHLSADQYKDRDAALRTLVGLGEYAYPALLQAAKSQDLETSRRAEDALSKIKDKVAAKNLRTLEEDRIVTPTFTIVGRIVTPSFTAKSEYFGEVKLSLGQLRNMKSVVEGGDADVKIEAAKYANANAWLETPVVLSRKSQLTITATGQVDTWPQGPGQYMCGPKGVFAGQNLGLPPQVLAQQRMSAGALLGKIGPSGTPFIVGDRWDGTIEQEGKLYLHIGPSNWGCASDGFYQVKIAVKK